MTPYGMTDFERLEDIKSNWIDIDWGIDKSDIDWLIKRVEELESELEYQLEVGQNKLDGAVNKYRYYRDLNNQYRDKVIKTLDRWEDNVKLTEEHNEIDYSSYRVGLIEGLQFAIDDLNEEMGRSLLE